MLDLPCGNQRGKRALDGIDLTIPRGQIYGLLGPNGAGKSTTINILAGMVNKTAGDVSIWGFDIDAHPRNAKNSIGIVPQEVAVFEELNVEENIDYFCGLYIKDKETRKAYVEEAIAFVGLEDFKKFFPKKLSGGLLRRLNIACGIAHKPKLIILDEPTVAVDPQSRNKILEGITKLNESGATIIYTSHYMDEVEQICTRIAIMDKGKNLALGTKEELKKMIKKSEIISIDIISLTEEDLHAISTLPHVYDVSFEDHKLTVLCNGGKHNLIRVLDYLQSKEYSFGHVHSELPSLNDVFLEITGKELRD